MTPLSSMGDFVDYKPYSRSRTFLNFLVWFLIPSALLDTNDPYERIGDELISRYPINNNIFWYYFNNIYVRFFFFGHNSFLLLLMWQILTSSSSGSPPISHFYLPIII